VSPLAHEEIQDLLGAYALDAVEPDEAKLIERHLETCPRCRSEVEGHREVASLLGNSGGDAPDGVWDRIADQLDDIPPPMRLDLHDGAATVTPLAARRRERTNRFIAAAANRAFDDPDAQKLQLQSADGAMTARAVVLPDGRGYLVAHELPGLDTGRSYQLWGDTGAGSLVSLGLLGDDPTTIAFQAGTDLDALAITDEVAGGVVQSKNPPVIAGTFD
jgi:Anti-sigma-K factor rskA/Putative zinc-finger